MDKDVGRVDSCSGANAGGVAEELDKIIRSALRLAGLFLNKY